jgi:hypothetical protein
MKRNKDTKKTRASSVHNILLAIKWENPRSGRTSSHISPSIIGASATGTSTQVDHHGGAEYEQEHQHLTCHAQTSELTGTKQVLMGNEYLEQTTMINLLLFKAGPDLLREMTSSHKQKNK